MTLSLKRFAVITLLLVTAWQSAHAMSGIAVCVMYPVNPPVPELLNAQLWRHDIVHSVVTKHTKLFDGPCNNAVLSPDGKWVAFVEKIDTMAGKVCVMSINGGTVSRLADVDYTSVLEFPVNDWIYYSVGGRYSTYDRQKSVKRVNRTSGVIEDVVTFATWGVGQLFISNDLTRAVIRGTEANPTPACILGYDMINGNGSQWRDLGQGCNSCAAGFSWDGQYVQDGWQGHNGVDIRRWSDASIVKSIRSYTAIRGRQVMVRPRVISAIMSPLQVDLQPILRTGTRWSTAK